MSILSKLVKIWVKIISRIRRKVVFKPPFDYDYTFKIMLFGEPKVGKTTLAQRFCFDIFNPSEGLTIGVDFYVKTIELHGKRVKLQIWVLGGEERFTFLLANYCRGANGAMIIYDITNMKSLDQIIEWIKIIREEVGDIPIMLVGNKLDLEESREFNIEVGIEIAKKYNLSSYKEISSKTGQNIEETFEDLTEIVINQ